MLFTNICWWVFIIASAEVLLEVVGYYNVVEFTKAVGFTLLNKVYIGSPAIGQNRAHCVFLCRDACQCVAAEWNETSRMCQFIKLTGNELVWQTDGPEITTILQKGSVGQCSQCEVSSWTEWTTCNAVNSTSSRNRSVINMQDTQVTTCPSLHEKNACIVDWCEELPGFFYPVTGHCYIIVTSPKKSWQNAYDDCSSRAPVGAWARLAHITDVSIFNGMNLGSHTNVWVGVRHFNGSTADPNNWYWVNEADKAVSRVGWVNGVFDTPGAVKCARYMASTGNSLDDMTCTTQYSYACEFIV